MWRRQKRFLKKIYDFLLNKRNFFFFSKVGKGSGTRAGAAV